MRIRFTVDGEDVEMRDADVEALLPMMRGEPDAWIATPPCFTPNERCGDLVRRGMLEMMEEDGRTRLRVTELGAAAWTRG